MKKAFVAIMFLFALVATALGQSSTPYIGLQIPPTGSNNWYIPLNYNFNKLDQILGGQIAIPALQITGDLHVGTITANTYVGQNSSTLATATTAPQGAVAYFAAPNSGTTVGGSLLSGVPYFAPNTVPRASLSGDIGALWVDPTCTANLFMKRDGTCSAGGGTSNITGQLNGYIPVASGPSALTGPSPLDYNVSNSGALTSSVPLYINLSSGVGGGFSIPEGNNTGWSAASGVDNLWADSTSHRLLVNQNGGTTLMLPGVAAAVTAGHVAAFAANGIDLVDGGTGGSGSVPGSSQQVIFNKNGAYGASSGLLFDDSIAQLSVVGGQSSSYNQPGTSNNTFNPAVPGYNLGNADFGPTGAYVTGVDTRAQYLRSQGNSMIYGGVHLDKHGDGDLNGMSFYQVYSGACSDASCEGYSGIHVYPYIGTTPLTGTIASGVGAGATSLVLATSNQASFGTNRIVVDLTDDVLSMNVTASAAQTDPSVPNSSYALLTVDNTTLPVSVQCTFTQDVATPGDNNTLMNFLPTSETFTANCPSALTVGTLVTIFGRIEPAKITAVGTWDSTAHTQSVTMPMRYSHKNGTVFLAGGLAGRAVEYTADTTLAGGTRRVFVLLGSTASNQIATATMAAGSMSNEFQSTGAIKIYHATRIANPIDAFHLTVMDNDAAWTAGANIEVVNGLHQTYKIFADDMLDNNPYSFGEHFVFQCESGQFCFGSKASTSPRSAVLHYNNKNLNSFYTSNGLNADNWMEVDGGVYNVTQMLNDPMGSLNFIQNTNGVSVLTFGNHTASFSYDLANGGNGEWNLLADKTNLPNASFSASLNGSFTSITWPTLIKSTDGSGSWSLEIQKPTNSSNSLKVDANAEFDGTSTFTGPVVTSSTVTANGGFTLPSSTSCVIAADSSHNLGCNTGSITGSSYAASGGYTLYNNTPGANIGSLANDGLALHLNAQQGQGGQSGIMKVTGDYNVNLYGTNGVVVGPFLSGSNDVTGLILRAEASDGNTGAPIELQINDFNTGAFQTVLHAQGVTTNGAKAGLSLAPNGGMTTLGGLLQGKTFTVSTLPTCAAGIADSIAVITDAASPSWGAAPTGGGSVHTLALCNGTAWTIH